MEKHGLTFHNVRLLKIINRKFYFAQMNYSGVVIEYKQNILVVLLQVEFVVQDIFDCTLEVI